AITIRAVEAVGESVVKIYTTERVFVDALFGRMAVEQEGIGSGIIIHEDGYILTNHHVVAGAEKIRVFLPDGRDFAGQVEGSDPWQDVDVVHVRGGVLAAEASVTSDDLRVDTSGIGSADTLGIVFTMCREVVRNLNSTLQREEGGVALEIFSQTERAI